MTRESLDAWYALAKEMLFDFFGLNEHISFNVIKHNEAGDEMRNVVFGRGYERKRVFDNMTDWEHPTRSDFEQALAKIDGENAPKDGYVVIVKSMEARNQEAMKSYMDSIAMNPVNGESYHYEYFWRCIDLCNGGAKTQLYRTKYDAQLSKPQNGLWRLEKKRVADRYRNNS